jgi:hypothetical protein
MDTKASRIRKQFGYGKQAAQTDVHSERHGGSAASFKQPIMTFSTVLVGTGPKLLIQLLLKAFDASSGSRVLGFQYHWTTWVDFAQ